MREAFSRTERLLGKEAMERLADCRVAVFGVGGVGGYAVEALARSGVGAIDLIDHDRVSLSNLNRQIIALHSTVGRYKVEVAAERIRDISPVCTVRTYQTFFLPETAHLFDFRQYDYVIDAIDTVTGKLALVAEANRVGVPIISSMGAGNKLDPTRFRVSDISRTEVDPLARVMRVKLRKAGIRHLKVVWSDEIPLTASAGNEEKTPESDIRRSVPGSTAFVPSVAGLILAGEVIRDLIAKDDCFKSKSDDMTTKGDDEK